MVKKLIQRSCVRNNCRKILLLVSDQIFELIFWHIWAKCNARYLFGRRIENRKCSDCQRHYHLYVFYFYSSFGQYQRSYTFSKWCWWLQPIRCTRGLDQWETANLKTSLNRSKSIWPFLSLHVTKLKLGFNPLSHDIWKFVRFFFSWVVTFIPSSMLYVLRRVFSLHPGGSPSSSFDFFFLPPLIISLEAKSKVDGHERETFTESGWSTEGKLQDSESKVHENGRFSCLDRTQLRLHKKI